MSLFLQLRLERHLLQKDAKNKVQERHNAIEMVKKISKLKTYKSLMKGMIRELTEFM